MSNQQKKNGFLNLYAYGIKLLSESKGRPPFVLDMCIVQCSIEHEIQYLMCQVYSEKKQLCKKITYQVVKQ